MSRETAQERSDRVLESVEELLQETEYEVVDVALVGSSRGTVVRVYVDTENGVSLDDCARLSRALGEHFEATGLMTSRYVLEVSSPGVDRPLRRPEHFARFAGERALVATHEKIEGRHKHVGTLGGFRESSGSVLLTLDSGEEITIPLGSIRKAHLKRDPWVRPGRGPADSPERNR